ncbi:diguanylate cyclase domain-containing protein [Zavarzinia compransoris]|uniref:diguanylate cyclase domain-containing protein n=1 Tax=Zavarzinia compransoris TaxID=1264899 RepID=UPI0010E5995C|nr:diguanylate cyclase [Zavarzinia compransoris]TDP47847.1 diguanylate cyclase (GGDEF)-like protein [Zavarzinia compransoris]
MPSRPPENEVAVIAPALDCLPQMVWILAPDGKVQHFNRKLADFVGPEAGTGDWLAWAHDADARQVSARWHPAFAAGAAFETEVRLRHHTGGFRWVLVIAAPERGRNGAIIRWYCTGTDIDARARQYLSLAETSRLQSSMLDASIDCIKIIRPDGRLAQMNRSGRIALGVPADEAEFGMKWLDLLPEEVHRRGHRALKAAGAGRNARFPGMSIGAGRTQYWDNILTPIQDAEGRTVRILCVSRDVTLQRAAERRLKVISTTDALTGLPNRRSLQAALKRRAARAKATGGGLGLLLLDLDRFKEVNDTFGHPAGDHLLRVVAKRLVAALGDRAVVARLGGDEFAVLAEGAEDLAALAETVLRQTAAPVTYDGHRLSWSLSIGGARFPRDAATPQGLVKCADAALNAVKAGGRDSARLFDGAAGR